MVPHPAADHGRNTQWILGFDGSCCTCSRLATQIVDLSAGKLLARSLRAPDVQRWREQVLGTDAPWVPTLFAFDGTHVRAWIGPAMAWRLAQLVGIKRTWQFARMLGDLATPASAIADPGRRRVLKQGLGAAAVTLAVLSGRSTIAIAAQGNGDLELEKPSPSEKAGLARSWRSSEQQKLSDQLKRDGFATEGSEDYWVVKRNGKLVRKVVTHQYRERGNGREAVLVMSVEQGTRRTSWHAGVFPSNGGRGAASATQGGQGARRLYIDRDGEVKTETKDPGGVAKSASGCSLCKGGCQGVIAGGTFEACSGGCAAACGPAFWVCAVPCRGACGGLAAVVSLNDLAANGCGWACGKIGFC